MLPLLLACTAPPTPRVPPPTPPPPTGDTASPDPTADTGAPTPPPEPPPGLQRWQVGEDADRDVVPTGPGLILMGGGVEPDAAFTWWTGLLSGGDVVVLRTSGSDGYNNYLFSEIGGVDSVETLLVDTRPLANHPYVAWRIAHAEGVFIAGGDQSTYIADWKGTGVEDALHAAWARGAVIGGTSAGLAVLGDRAFSAENGTVYSDEALADPFNPYMTFEDDFLDLSPMAGWVTDSHFAERDRMGRLLGFVARMIADGAASPARGVGVDESTALLVGPDGVGTVVGSGSVYILVATTAPETCVPGEPLSARADLLRLGAGDTIAMPSGASPVPSAPLQATAGVLDPADPY